MDGWVGNILYLFINYIFIFKNQTIFKIFFFWLPNFLFDLTNQKDYFMVSKKITS